MHFIWTEDLSKQKLKYDGMISNKTLKSANTKLRTLFPTYNQDMLSYRRFMLLFSFTGSPRVMTIMEPAL